MAEWRDILERAADNLALDLDGRSPASFRQQPAGWPAPRQPFTASRDLLARELESSYAQAPGRPQANFAPMRARAEASAYRAPITQSITQPIQEAELPPAPQKRAAAKKNSAARELATVSVSVGVVALALYGFFALLH